MGPDASAGWRVTTRGYARGALGAGSRRAAGPTHDGSRKVLLLRDARAARHAWCAKPAESTRAERAGPVSVWCDAAQLGGETGLFPNPKPLGRLAAPHLG